MKTTVENIVTTYSRMGVGLQIHIIRSDGTNRTYPYKAQYQYWIYYTDIAFNTAYFPRSIHLTRV